MGGKGKTVGPEGRANMSRAKKGVPKSESHRRAIAEGKRGKPRSEEAKRLISEGKLKYHASEEYQRVKEERSHEIVYHTCSQCGQIFFDNKRQTTMCSSECKQERYKEYQAKWREENETNE